VNQAVSPIILQQAPIALTAQLVERARAIAGVPLQVDAKELAQQCILDWVGVALAGAGEPLVGLLLAQAQEEGGNAVATAIGSERQFSARQAALINGAAGHAIDYDDANFAAQGHVTAAVLPAALALAETLHASGDQLLRAFAAGYEMTGMVGQYVGRAHYERGFHGTCTVGSFGAACAAAILLGLDAPTMATALGIAGTQAGGMKAQFGTMCKPLHAGKASENGVLAAQLAKRGFTGRRDLLEAPQGFAAATTPEANPQAALAIPPRGSHMRNNLFKYHAACYGTHAALEALNRLRRDHNLFCADVERIEIDVEPGAERMCDIIAPSSGLEAKFSLRFNAALAIAGEDTSSPHTYSATTAQRPDLIALRDRVTVRFMPDGWPHTLVDVRVLTRDGRHLAARYDSGTPEPDLQRQGDRVRGKFMALATPRLGASGATALMRAIGALGEMEDVGSLMSVLRSSTATHLS
jgi:2-methylcitrate dehydratase PrpD